MIEQERIKMRLHNAKLKGMRVGWTVVEVTSEYIKFFKSENQNLHVNIDGDIELIYNAVEHSVTTTLIHNGEIKTLKRFVKKDKFKPVTDALLYPRAHLGAVTVKHHYIK